MKTTGTAYLLINAWIFMMALSLFTTSCDKDTVYPLTVNTKLDLLAAKFKGVTELSTDICAMKDTITKLQKIVAGLPESSSTSILKAGLNNVNNRNNRIAASVTNLANMGITTKSMNDSLKIDLMTLSSKADADNVFLKSQISIISPTNIIQKARLNTLLKTNTSLTLQISNAIKSLNNIATISEDTAIQAVVNVLLVQMNCAKASLDILLTTYTP